MVYVQGLALTYTLVGVIAGFDRCAVDRMAATALGRTCRRRADGGTWFMSMFGLFNIQLPNSVQSYFQTKATNSPAAKSFRLHHGYFCPPDCRPLRCALRWHFALGYIGQTGDAVLGGLALCLGTRHRRAAHHHRYIRRPYPAKAGDWMNGIKYAFGFIFAGCCRIPCYTASALFRSSQPLHLADDCSRPYAFSEIRQTKGRLKTVAAVLGFTADWRLMVWLAKPQ